jgi:hypothetical protein
MYTLEESYGYIIETGSAEVVERVTLKKIRKNMCIFFFLLYNVDLSRSTFCAFNRRKKCIFLRCYDDDDDDLLAPISQKSAAGPAVGCCCLHLFSFLRRRRRPGAGVGLRAHSLGLAFVDWP